jgi:signal peptidase I
VTSSPRQTRKLGKAWWIVFAVGFLGLAGLVWFVAFHRTFQIKSGSMAPTLLPGDRVLVRMWRFETPSPKRGDLVVYQAPYQHSTVLIHRLVALPGDRVEIVAKHLRINGKEIAEPYAVHRDQRTYGSGEGPIALRDNLAPAVVPADQFFVLGDNRDTSYDSRFWGTVSRGNLLGGGEVMVYLSLDPKTGEPRSGRMGRRLR